MVNADLAEKRTCIKCERELTLADFYPNAKSRGGYTGKCKDCHLEEWRLRKYGLTTEDYERLLELQGSVCAICQCEEAVMTRKKIRRLAVDHDHDTGLVRGLLCTRCNIGLGKFRDNTTIMTLALTYLHDHAKQTRHKSHGCHFKAEGSLSAGWSCN